MAKDASLREHTAMRPPARGLRVGPCERGVPGESGIRRSHEHPRAGHARARRSDDYGRGSRVFRAFQNRRNDSEHPCRYRLAVTDIHEIKTGRRQKVSIDVRHAAVSCNSSKYLSAPAPDGDFNNPQDVATLKRLVRTADVFSQGYRPGIMDKHGLGPEALSGCRERRSRRSR